MTTRDEVSPGLSPTEAGAREFVDIPAEPFEQEYLAPVHRIGIITTLAISAAMFLPAALLYLVYGVAAPWDAVLVGMGLALTYLAPFAIIEPISYYPIYGDAGNYMSMTAGNIANLRLPCAAVAQAVAGVPEGTRKGAAVGAIGIAASIFAGIVGVFLGAVAGGAVVSALPAWLVGACKTYLPPALWGAVLGQFALRGPYYLIPALFFAGIPLLLKWPAYVGIPMAVFGTLLTGLLLYKRFRISPRVG
jgi:hypothetical protein